MDACGLVNVLDHVGTFHIHPGEECNAFTLFINSVFTWIKHR